MRRAITHWLPLALYLGLIFWLSSLTNAQLPLPDFRFSDKLAHGVEYGLVGLLAARALRFGGPGLEGRRLVLVATLAGALYGVSDELHQAAYPERRRVGDPWDAAADAVGALAGAALFERWSRRSPT